MQTVFVGSVRSYLADNAGSVREIAGAGRLAARRALGDREAARITYFGDGPWDARASADLGYDFVAVGGRVAHSVAYSDLSDVEAILAHLAIDGTVAA